MNVIKIALLALWVLSMTGKAEAGRKTDREQERLIGPVKTVLIEIAKFANRSGKWVEEGRIPWTSTSYDTSGRRTEENQLYEDVALNFKSIFSYDAEGNLAEGAEYDFRGTPVFKWTYTHDPDRKKIEEIRHEAEGPLFSKSSFLFDGDGNLIEEYRSHAHIANDFKWVYLYDSEGKKKEETFYVIRARGVLNKTESAVDFKRTFIYDAKGHLTEEVRYDAAGEVKYKKSYSYEFDSHGNWIAQTAKEWVTRSGQSYFEPTEVTYRTITYHTR